VRGRRPAGEPSGFRESVTASSEVFVEKSNTDMDRSGSLPRKRTSRYGQSYMATA
jgi:hypothetical protein